MKQERHVDESNNCWIILTKLLIVIDLHLSFSVFCERCSGKGSKTKRRKSLWFDPGSYSEGAKRSLKTVRVKKKNNLYFSSFIDTFIFFINDRQSYLQRSNFIFSTSAVEDVYWIDFFFFPMIVKSLRVRLWLSANVSSVHRLSKVAIVFILAWRLFPNNNTKDVSSSITLISTIMSSVNYYYSSWRLRCVYWWDTWDKNVHWEFIEIRERRSIVRSVNIELSDRRTEWIRF